MLNLNLASAHFGMGHYSIAFKILKPVIADFELNKRHAFLSQALVLEGQLFSAIGDSEMALRSLNKSEEILRTYGGTNPDWLFGLLWSQFSLSSQKGEIVSARKDFERATRIGNQYFSNNLHVRSLTTLMEVLLLIHERKFDDAESVLNENWQLFVSGSKENAHLNKAVIFLKTNRKQAAIDELGKIVVGSATKTGPTSGYAIAAQALGQVHKDLGDQGSAIFWASQAVNAIQAERAQAGMYNGPYASTYLSRRLSAYSLLIDLLISEGRLIEAEQVQQMLKEREFYEEIERTVGAQPSMSRVAMDRAETVKAEELNRLGRERSALAASLARLDKIPSGQRTEANRRDRAQIEVALTDHEEKYKAFMATLQQGLVKLRAQTESQAPDVQVTQTRMVRVIDELEKTRAGTTGKAAGLQFILADKRLSILLRLPGSAKPIAYQTAIEENLHLKISSQVHRFGAAMNNSKSVAEDVVHKGKTLPGYLSTAQGLYDLLIRPVEDILRREKIEVLMVSATDVLRLVPLAALHDKTRGRYLIQDFAISTFNEAGTTDDDISQMTRQAKGQWRVAGFGLSEQVENMPALVAVREEIQSVTSKAAGGKSWMDPKFTLNELRSAIGGPFDVLHLATHYSLDFTEVGNSRLYLGDKSALTLRQLRQDPKSFAGVDMVALSACQTGVNPNLKSYGAEMESMAATLQRKKAPAVLATMWKVADASTGMFMDNFYARKAQGATKAEAIRQAQLDMLNAIGAHKSEWKHPYYWAPFIMLGNWL